MRKKRKDGGGKERRENKKQRTRTAKARTAIFPQKSESPDDAGFLEAAAGRTTGRCGSGAGGGGGGVSAVRSRRRMTRSAASPPAAVAEEEAGGSAGPPFGAAACARHPVAGRDGRAAGPTRSRRAARGLSETAMCVRCVMEGPVCD